MNRWEKIAQERLKEINFLKKQIIDLKIREKEFDLLKDSNYLNEIIENKLLNQSKDFIKLKETIKKLTKKLEDNNLVLNNLEDKLDKEKNISNNLNKYKIFVENLTNCIKYNNFDSLISSNILYNEFNILKKFILKGYSGNNKNYNYFVQNQNKLFSEFENKISNLQLEVINGINYNMIENKEEFLIKRCDFENMKTSFELQIIYLDKKCEFLKGENELLLKIIQDNNTSNIDNITKLNNELNIEKSKNLYYNKKIEEFFSELLNLNSKYIK